jgi:hypothetical protein
MKSIEIVFKSGAIVTAEASDVTWHRNKLTGELVGLDWVTPDSAKRKLRHLDLGEVAAVVVLR